MAERLDPPPPLDRLRGITPEVHPLPINALIWRIYFARGAFSSDWNSFRHFGPTNSRFDHHPLPRSWHEDRGIQYGADSWETCFAEVFQETRTIDRFTGEPHLVAYRPTREVLLLDLTGSWITRAGGSMAIGTGNRETAREWSRAIYAAFPTIEGIRYPSSMDANRPALALFERAHSALSAWPEFDRPLSDAALDPYIERAGRRFGYAAVPLLV